MLPACIGMKNGRADHITRRHVFFPSVFLLVGRLSSCLRRRRLPVAATALAVGGPSAKATGKPLVGGGSATDKAERC